VVTAGPTREMLDPVRFLSNVSTGQMGYHIAREAKRMGFQVTLISGPTSLQALHGVRFVPVVSAEDMKKAVLRQWPKTDILIMTAAVCDYTPVRYSPQKIKRLKQKTIRFKRTSDILAAVGRRKGNRVLVGFSLETEKVEANAVQKLRRKNLDLIVANWFNARNNPFGNRNPSMLLIGRAGFRKPLTHVSKAHAARLILKEALKHVGAKNS